jgi:hypothetical protein
MKSNLNEQVGRIKSMMGLIMEQNSMVVSIEGKVPITSGKDDKGNIVDTTDWDGVHAIISSKRPEYNDTLVDRVEPYLKRKKYRVTNVKISSKKVGSEIITNGSVTLNLITQGQKPHTIFTTRGSLGYDYIARYDAQVSGLEDRIKSTYGSTSVETFGPFDVNVVGTSVNYKQIFYAADSSETAQNTTAPLNIYETRPATKKSLDVLYALNKARFQNNPGKYILSKFNIVSANGNVTYTLSASPNWSGYDMLAMVIGDDALKRVEVGNADPETKEIKTKVLDTKIVNVLNQDTNQNQDYKVMIVGIRY